MEVHPRRYENMHFVLYFRRISALGMHNKPGKLMHSSKILQCSFYLCSFLSVLNFFERFSRCFLPLITWLVSNALKIRLTVPYMKFNFVLLPNFCTAKSSTIQIYLATMVIYLDSCLAERLILQLSKRGWVSVRLNRKIMSAIIEKSEYATKQWKLTHCILHSKNIMSAIIGKNEYAIKQHCILHSKNVYMGRNLIPLNSILNP